MPFELKNYYSILKLDFFESNQSAIKSAYKKLTEQYHPTSYRGDDLRKHLVELNEAFLVLSDSNSKKLYDSALSADPNIDYESLENIISAKHKKAENFISSYFNGTQKKKKSVWKIIGIILLCMLVLGSIGRIIAPSLQNNNSSTYQQPDATPVNLGTFSAPSDWTYYKIDDSFSIYVPPTIELRKEYDKYTHFLSQNHMEISNADVVFQQNELNNMTKEAFKTYCRIMFNRYYVGNDYVEHYYESPQLTVEDKRNLKELADSEVTPWKYINQPSYRWVKANGNNAIEISYTREGANGEVVCHIYLFCNHTEMVKVITSYRKVDEETWKKDVNDVIKTFKWSNPK